MIFSETPTFLSAENSEEVHSMVANVFQTGGPGTAALSLGKPYQEPVTVKVALKMLDPLVGVYTNEQNEDVYIKRESEKKFCQRAGGEKTEIFPTSTTAFFFKDPFTRVEFLKDKKGLVTELRAIGRIGPIQSFKRTNKPFPAEKKEISLDQAIFDQYVGEYEIAPGMTVEVTKEGDKLMIQPAGQEKNQLFPESETKFFLKVADIEVEFVKDQTGKVTGLIAQCSLIL